MLDNKLFEKLAILTPSRITTAQRYAFAKASLESLHNGLQGLTPDHIVVHDSPAYKRFFPKSLRHLNSSLNWDSRARGIYNYSETTWLTGKNTGSAAALLTAVKVALDSGKTYGFIHLDDHVYTEECGILFSHGLEAMQENQNLLWVRFSGYPVIYQNRLPFQLGLDGEISFDGVRLTPTRTEKYTLWRSRLSDESIRGDYWPIALWFCIYKLSVLKAILEWAIENKAKHLAHAELFYKNGTGFTRLLDRFPSGEFGYINMQFGGIEMHRNPNWRGLMALSNEEVL